MRSLEISARFESEVSESDKSSSEDCDPDETESSSEDASISL
ncbi:hypothetical protein WN944_023852 [Citrus x changshan-huyou]|uniref:Uncharacterized protein n=1 Tax=Citrus x changshan-huyou TaxID=2935761 RepID=A0AAP0LMD7_9ROSI